MRFVILLLFSAGVIHAARAADQASLALRPDFRPALDSLKRLK